MSDEVKIPHSIPIAILLLAVLWHVILVRLAPRLSLVKPNFQRKPILASYGLVQFPYIVAVALVLVWGFPLRLDPETQSGEVVWLYLGVMAVMWVLGAIDDVWGSREVGGFKGHFRKLLFERKLTTGAVKAMGGGLVALTAGWTIVSGFPLRSSPETPTDPNSIVQAVLAAMVIALATNTLNLFDLRPGRAVAVLFCGLGVTCIVTCGRLVAWPLVALIAAVALVFGVADSRGKAMMGDSGSNSLGAALGLTIALSAPNWIIPAIILFAAVHVYSEKRSISQLIERNRVLRTIDRYLGVR